MIGRQRQATLDDTDEMPADLRACVHEFGYPIVACLRKHGIESPGQVREIVREIWNGAREVGGMQRQGLQEAPPAVRHLDWLLIQAGCPISAVTLHRLFASHDLVVVSRNPTAAMIEASMDATNHMGVVTKREKHARQLRAALSAEARRSTACEAS